MSRRVNTAQVENQIASRRESPATTVFSRDYLVMKPLITWLNSIAPKYASGTLLDFGCGNKPYYPFFKDRIDKYVGVDLTQNRFDSVDIILQKDETLPCRKNSIDTVLSTQVLEHVPDPETYLRDISRVLKPGGYLILTCPGAYMLHEEPEDYYRYTIYGLKHLLSQCNFEIVRIDTAGGAWRLMGQTFLNHKTFARKLHVPLLSPLLYYGFVISTNVICSFLDAVNTNEKDVVNYMAIAQKRKP